MWRGSRRQGLAKLLALFMSGCDGIGSCGHSAVGWHCDREQSCGASAIRWTCGPRCAAVAAQIVWAASFRLLQYHGWAFCRADHSAGRVALVPGAPHPRSGAHPQSGRQCHKRKHWCQGRGRGHAAPVPAPCCLLSRTGYPPARGPMASRRLSHARWPGCTHGGSLVHVSRPPPGPPADRRSAAATSHMLPPTFYDDSALPSSFTFTLCRIYGSLKDTPSEDAPLCLLAVEYHNSS